MAEPTPAAPAVALAQSKSPDALMLAVGEADGVHVVVIADDDIDPVIGGRQRHLDFGDDAVGAIGVGDLVQVLAGQFQHARRGFHGDDAQAQHIAEIAQAPEIDGADAARTARDETAQRGGGRGRGVEAQFLTGMLLTGAVKIGGQLKDPVDDHMGRLELRRMSYVQRMSKLLSERLWSNAGTPDVDKDRLAVVIGTGLGGAEAAARPEG